MKYLENAASVRNFTTRKEVQEYLDFRKEQDIWRAPYIDECAVVGIENNPLFNQNLSNKTYYLENMEIQGCKSSDETMQECIEDSGLFLMFSEDITGKRYSSPTTLWQNRTDFTEEYTIFTGISIILKQARQQLCVCIKMP